MGNKASVRRQVTTADQAARDDGSDLLVWLNEMNALETNIKDGDDLATPLILAARDGKLDFVKFLLLYEANVEARGTIKDEEDIIEGCTALWIAAAKGHLDVVRLLIEQNADVDGRTSTNSTPLKVAACYGRLDIVRCLVENGADINARNYLNSTPLMITCYKGHMDVVSFLVGNGADIHQEDSNGETCLHYAAQGGQFQIVGKLLPLGAKLKHNHKGLTPLLAASNHCETEMVEYFISRPECTKEQRIDALELLGATIANDPDAYDIEKAFSFMKRGMEERYKNPSRPLPKKKIKPVEAYQNRRESQTLGELSLLEGNDHAIHMEGLLIRERILGTDNTELRDPIKYRAAVLADSKEYKLCIALWTRAMEIAMSFDVPKTEELKQFTALFAEMIQIGHSLSPKSIENILEKLVDGNRKLTEAFNSGKLQEEHTNETQQKLLFYALYLLIMYKKVQVPPEMTNDNIINCLQRFLHSNPCSHPDGNTLLHLAVWHKTPVLKGRVRRVCKFPCIETMKLILHAGCDVNAVNTEGNTPLHLAVTFVPEPEHVEALKEMLELLLDFGADTKLVNKNGETAMECCETDEAQRIMSAKEGLEAMNIVARKDEEAGCDAGRGARSVSTTEKDVNENIKEETIRKELLGPLRELTHQLENVQEQLRKRDRQLGDRDGKLREMTQQLTDSKRQLQERDGQLGERDGQLIEKDRQLRERDGQLGERNEQVRQMTQQLKNAQRRLQERDGELREKDGKVRERDGQVREMTQQLKNTQRRLQERDGKLRERDGKERERDEQLKEMTQQLTHVQKQLQERDGQLRERDGQVSQMTRQLTTVGGQLQVKNGEVTSLESLLGTKQHEIDELKTSLSAVQKALNEHSHHLTPDWVISRDQIQLTDKFLGKGGWGSVVEGKYCACAVAVKQMYELIISDHNRRLFEREMSIAARCHHPCLLLFIGATNDEGGPLFVTELMESSLRALLEQRPLSNTEVSVISLDVARALNYLHLKKPVPIIHRDISSANVLLWRQADQWRGKVSDYGTANVVQQIMTVGPGATIYSAPEARTEHQSVMVDVYSFGVLLCEMCIRELPDPDRRDEQVARVTNRVIRALIRGCLQEDAEERPNMKDIIAELEQPMVGVVVRVHGQIEEKNEEISSLEERLRARDQEVIELETSLSAAQRNLTERSRQQTPDWVISRDQIQLTENCLGSGGWGKVVEGKYCGCTVAIKQIYGVLLNSSPYYRELFEREMNIASRCRHPCLLQFIGATNDEESPLFVTELMETSLRKLVEERPLSRNETSVISLDVARALNYLHLKKPRPIIHRDISSANVLLWRQNNQWRGKVSDYGAANFTKATMTACPGAEIYSAPEAFTEHQNLKVDVYSFGVLLCEMSTGILPDRERRDEQVATVTDRVFRTLIRRCLQRDPEARPSMEEIIRELERLV